MSRPASSGSSESVRISSAGAAAEQSLEEFLEVLVHGGERGGKPRARLAVEVGYALAEPLDRFGEIVALGNEAVVLRFDFAQLLVGAKVHGAEPLALLLVALQLRFDGGGIGLLAVVFDDFLEFRARPEFRRALRRLRAKAWCGARARLRAALRRARLPRGRSTARRAPRARPRRRAIALPRPRRGGRRRHAARLRQSEICDSRLLRWSANAGGASIELRPLGACFDEALLRAIGRGRARLPRARARRRVRSRET